MIKLSVNINKVATLRNARGGNIPDVVKTALKIENFGADGITVHPRPDERHIRYDDVRKLKEHLRKEFNVEGYPSADFMKLIEEVQPTQVTLVPDAPDALTSNAGWDTVKHGKMLAEIVERLRKVSRVSIFVDALPEMIEGAKACGADRVELYTESYARLFIENKNLAVAPFVTAAKKAEELGIGLNAGHDLNYYNLNFFNKKIPNLMEVSIGHALICDALDFGLKTTINIYRRCLFRSKKYVNQHCLLTAEEINEAEDEIELPTDI
ncbi:MAG: pyridoxine 5'-phosphate synthase [Bacteroidales bacterium]|jgi:pyridoxine 5-phosphate synthase|nr:pyridoxine 5'-phosphate synthase [Bacteroidales bacterium]